MFHLKFKLQVCTVYNHYHELCACKISSNIIIRCGIFIPSGRGFMCALIKVTMLTVYQFLKLIFLHLFAFLIHKESLLIVSIYMQDYKSMHICIKCWMSCFTTHSFGDIKKWLCSSFIRNSNTAFSNSAYITM